VARGFSSTKSHVAARPALVKGIDGGSLNVKNVALGQFDYEIGCYSASCKPGKNSTPEVVQEIAANSRVSLRSSRPLREA
jgi:hypothetical protein